MNNIFFDKIINEKYKFKEIKRKDINYLYYKKQINELKKQNIKQYSFKEAIALFRKTNYEKINDILKNINENVIYKSYGHGINHNHRVLFYSIILSNLMNINMNDLKLVVYASMYHDIGRTNDFTDPSHGFKSACKIDSLNININTEELNILKTIVTCHSLTFDNLFEISKQNDVKDYEKCRQLFNILKDADALDRTRLEYPYIKLNYLKTSHSLKLVKMAYNLYYNFKKIIKCDEEMYLEKSKIYCYKKYKYHFRTRKIINEQIDAFFKIENSDFKLENHSYNLGDFVYINKDNLLHNIQDNEETLSFISRNGIVSKDIATGTNSGYCHKCVSSFWRAENNMNFKDYFNCDNRYLFILNIKSDEAKELMKNDINANGYDKSVIKHFIERNGTSDFDKKTSYVIFGLNKCFIEGIMVSKEIEKNQNKLTSLKEKFPNCYISNEEGVIIHK